MDQIAIVNAEKSHPLFRALTRSSIQFLPIELGIGDGALEALTKPPCNWHAMSCIIS